MDQVEFINGKTRLYGIVGDPIEQVRSPEMVTWEMQRRQHNAVLVPLHVAREEFDSVMTDIMRIRNLDGLIFTIPFKVKAASLAKSLGPQATQIGAINALKKIKMVYGKEKYLTVLAVLKLSRDGLFQFMASVCNS